MEDNWTDWNYYISFFFSIIYYLSDFEQWASTVSFLFNPLLLVFARWQTVLWPGKCPTNFLLFQWLPWKILHYNGVTSVETKKRDFRLFIELSSECGYQLFIWLLDHWDSREAFCKRDGRKRRVRYSITKVQGGYSRHVVTSPSKAKSLETSGVPFYRPI